MEIVPPSDLMDEDEIHGRPRQFFTVPKPRNNGNNNPGTTSVHELLECPVCTNSMYPPIHQVCALMGFAYWVQFCLWCVQFGCDEYVFEWLVKIGFVGYELCG